MAIWIWPWIICVLLMGLIGYRQDMDSTLTPNTPVEWWNTSQQPTHRDREISQSLLFIGSLTPNMIRSYKTIRIIVTHIYNNVKMMGWDRRKVKLDQFPFLKSWVCPRINLIELTHLICVFGRNIGRFMHGHDQSPNQKPNPSGYSSIHTGQV
jgi:hypothetical protein